MKTKPGRKKATLWSMLFLMLSCSLKLLCETVLHVMTILSWLCEATENLLCLYNKQKYQSWKRSKKTANNFLTSEFSVYLSAVLKSSAHLSVFLPKKFQVFSSSIFLHKQCFNQNFQKWTVCSDSHPSSTWDKLKVLLLSFRDKLLQFYSYFPEINRYSSVLIFQG